MKNIRVILLLVVCLFMFAGCASMQSVIGNKQKGMARKYSVSKEEAFIISKKILMEIGASISSEDKVKGEIYAETGYEVGSYGTYIGIWIDEFGEKEAVVTVYTRKVLATTIKSGLSKNKFHREFATFID